LAEPRPWTTESGELRANIEVTANIVQFLGSASDGNGGSADPMAAGAVQANVEEAYANGYKAALQELAAKAAQNAKKEAANAMAEMNVEATEADEEEAQNTLAEESAPDEPAPEKEEVYRPSAIAQSETPDAADAEVKDKPEDDEVETAVENDDAEADDDENLTMMIDASNMLDQIQNTISAEAATEEEAEEEAEPEEEAKPEPATVSEDIPF